MATRAEIAQYIAGQIDAAGHIEYKKMFGEYGVYCDGKMVMLVCDDQMFVKPTVAGREYIGEPDEGQPYPGAKMWFLIPEDQWDDAPWLCELVRVSLPEIAVPVKKKKK